MEDLVIAVILLVVLFGVLRFLAKILAWGLLIFIGIPFILSGLSTGFDPDQMREQVVSLSGEALATAREWIGEVDLADVQRMLPETEEDGGEAAQR